MPSGTEERWLRCRPISCSLERSCMKLMPVTIWTGPRRLIESVGQSNGRYVAAS
jgi:hypothetical protein